MSFVTTDDGTTLWWEAVGRGEPLLLIQGLGYPSDMWYRVIGPLSADHRVIRFDNRGVGRSDVPAGPYPIARMVADAMAVLSAAGETSAHVFGVSMGGIIAQELVLTHPEAVRALILGCTHAGGPGVVAPEPEALAMLQARTTLSPTEAARVAVPFVYAPSTPAAVIEEDIRVRLSVPTTPEGYTGQLMGAATWTGSADRLGTITAPTLVLTGDRDRLVPPGNSVQIGQLIPGATVRVLPDASHVFFSDQPAAAVAAVSDFLTAVRSPSTVDS